MGITKCRICLQPVTRVTAPPESGEPVWLHQRLDSPFTSLMEKIMSKTSDATSECELTIDELNAVSGAAGVETIPIVIGPMGGCGGLMGGYKTAASEGWGN